jgi:UDP-N-acetylmuramoylalanine--D-glutamate ligase
MTPATVFAGKSVALFGLGGSGLATALALQAGGARVLACDDNPASMAAASEKGVETGDLKTADWARFAALVLSPGVPLTHPEPHWSAKLAKEAGIEIIGDIELFCRERSKLVPRRQVVGGVEISEGSRFSPAPLVAITGTNGKSTTTALVAHILRQADKDVQVGGNIGTAILSLEPPSENRFHVIEMSSFQIDLTPSLAPTIGVLLNISPDHLDRHGTLESYAAIKQRLVAAAETGVIGIDDDPSRATYCRLREQSPSRPLIAISGDYTGEGIFTHEGRLARLIQAGPQAPWLELLVDLKDIRSLRGTHNAQNAAAAFAACEALGLTHEEIARGMRTFPGLPHRMEEVGRRGQAIFVNDSKATNADSTEKALASYEHIYWILGGKAKDGGIAPLRGYFPKVEKAYLIGAATDEFAKALDGQVRFARCGTLDKAVAQAAEDVQASAASEPVVLLSPACASYDQYRNFEIRGDHFRDLVRALPGIRMNSKAE